MQRHRLALLLGILVALVFFYLGVNTWIESQRTKTIPPPVVRAKPPVQTTPPAETVKPKEVVENPEPVKEEKVEEKQEQIKEPEKVQEAPKKELKDFVFQIGAFKKKENARKSLKNAKDKGFDAFIVEEEGLFKVRVRVKAESLELAITKVKKDFKEAFLVR